MINWPQFILILFFTLFSVHPLSAQWKEVPIFGDSALISGIEVFDIEFNTDSTAVAICQYFIVLTTNTSGEIWHQRQNLIDTAYGSYFTGLYHIDSSQFIITGPPGVYRSFDGFYSYHVISYAQYPFLGILGGLSVTGADEFHFLSIYRNVYIKSENFASNTFKSIGGLDTSDAAAVNSAMEVFFVSDSVGYILSSREPMHIGSSVIHRTLDGGHSWKKILDGFGILDFHFFNDSTGIGYDGIGNLFRTSDYGDTWHWEDIPIHGWPPTMAVPHPLEIVNDSIWYVYSGTEIIRTSNAGASWQSIAPPDCGNCAITELECPNDTTCFVGIYPTGIYKADNVERLITGVHDGHSVPFDKDILLIHPNPAHSQITIKGLAGYVHPRLTVTNTLGQVIHQELVANKSLQLSVSHWPSGIYLVTVEEDGQPVATGKFVVE